MDDNKYTKAELVIGGRDIPETVRVLVTDYYDIQTKTPDELGFLTFKEAQKMYLTESQKEVFYYVVNCNLRMLLSPQSGLRIRLNGRICSPGTVSVALKKLQEYDLIRTFNIIEYASFFAKYNRGGKPKVKFPEPIKSSFFTHLGYFTRRSGGKKSSLPKLLKHLGKRGRKYILPKYSYARILYKGEPFKRVFPKPKNFIPFHLYDSLMTV